MPPELHFLRPLWFLALLPLLALLVVLGRSYVRDQVWRPLVDPHLLPHLLDESTGPRRRLPLALLALGWLLAVLALAGPVWERLPAPVFSVDSKRVILLDISPSMNAADVPPSRLARARFEVLDLLGASREGQVALIAYGPEPFVVSPLTGDAQTIADQVPRLTSDLIPVPGPRRTDLALQAAGELLAQGSGGPGEVILIADGLGGGAADQTRAIAAARALSKAGHRVSVLAVGTVAGAPLPDGSGGFASDKAGAIQLSRLDRQGLEALSRAGGGPYVELAAGDEDTRALLDNPPPMQGQMTEQEGLTADRWREEGPWLLVALLPLAALGFRRGWLIPVLACVVLLPPKAGWALDWSELWQRPDQQGAQSFGAGDYQAAANAFRDSAWRAAARYKSEDYGGALEDLEGAEGAESDYNKGNALARLGQIDDAIAAYEKALEQEPGHEDAQANLELLRRLKEQQQQQEQQSQGSQGEGEKQPQEGAQGDQSQGSQGEQDQASEQGGQQSGDQGSQESSGTSGSQGDEQSQQEAQGEQPEGSQGDQGGTSDQGGDQGAKDASRSQGEDGSAGGEGDLSRQAVEGEATPDLGPDGQESAAAETGKGDDGEPREGEPAGLGVESADLSPEERERKQALEAQLRRVPDDPAGLLRQRFILQHLRREGRLP